MTATRKPNEPKYRWLDHAADVGIQAQAADLEQLFTALAGALTAVMGFTPAACTADSQAIDLSLEAADREQLLVDWLNEILYLAVTEGAVPARVDIDVRDGRQLQARVEVLPATRSGGLEIKAVTYHGATIRVSDDGWVGKVFMDV